VSGSDTTRKLLAPCSSLNPSFLLVPPSQKHYTLVDLGHDKYKEHLAIALRNYGITHWKIGHLEDATRVKPLKEVSQWIKDKLWFRKYWLADTLVGLLLLNMVASYALLSSIQMSLRLWLCLCS
jgi:hypothetical protein